MNAIDQILAQICFCFAKCPGFGQDRVNFHWNPGRGIAGWTDPTWPNRAEYSIPCAVMLDSGGGERGGGNSLAAREHAASVWSGRVSLSVVRFVLCFLLICIVVVPVFPLFAVLLNCPYPDPSVFCSFLSILLHTPAGGGAAAWHFCCLLQPNHNIKFGAQAWGRDNGRAEQHVLKQLS